MIKINIDRYIKFTSLKTIVTHSHISGNRPVSHRVHIHGMLI